MSAPNLAPVLRQLGTTSVREMFRRTGVADQSVGRQTRRGAVRAYYDKHGGPTGTFGPTLTSIDVNGSTTLASFAGGRIRLTDGSGPQGEQITVVRVRYVGLHCIKESDWDQGSGQDEPYFIIGVAGANGSRTQRFAYEDINTGSKRFEAADIVSEDDEIGPPIVLAAFGVEHDMGSKDEAEGKVRKAIEAAEKKLDAAAKVIGGLYGVPVDNHVIPEGWRDVIIGWAPEAAAAIFGLGDDTIGRKPKVLFDNVPDLLEWRAPAVQGKHGDNEYNVVLNIDGGDEGNYDLFFLVDLADITLKWREREG